MIKLKRAMFLLCPLAYIFISCFTLGAPTSALKHDIVTIPVLQPRTYGSLSTSGLWSGVPFSIYGSDFPDSITGSENLGVIVSYNSSTGKCEVGRNSSTGRDNFDLITNHYTTGVGITGYVSGGSDYLALSSSDNYRFVCLDHTDPFGGVLTIPNVIPGGMKPSWGSPNNVLYDGSLYAWDHMYLRHSQTINGVVSDYNLRSADFTRDYVALKQVSEFTIPFDVWDFDKYGPLTEGRSIRLEGSFYFKNGGAMSQGPVVNNYSSTNSFAKLYLTGTDPALNGTARVQSSGGNCTWSNNDYGEDFEIKYACEIIVNRDWSSDSIVQFYFQASAGSGCEDSCYLWKFQSDMVDWFFHGSYFVSDNDWTPGPDYGDECRGEFCNHAPGSGVRDPDGGDDDWFSSIVNLFHFNLVNPFLPIFNMFTTGSECVNIPTISGMLGSNQTTYCPWFDSSVIQIATPVFSIFSIMLVFGFFVHWLGSSSGNFFEDSSGETLTVGKAYDYKADYTGYRAWRNRSTASKNRRINK